MAKRDFVFSPDGEMLPSDSAPAQMRREEIAATAPKSQAKPAAKKETFREAFARNRAAGKDTFTWNGKKYTTEMAKPTPRAPAAKTAPADTRRPGPTRERAADMPSARPAPARQDASTSRGVRAETPAQKPKTGYQAQRERDEQRREERREFGRRRAEARKEESTPSPRRRRAQSLREESQARRAAAAEMSPAERSMARGRRIKETFGMAKGGNVSKRADGIATKGKTKCKII